MAAAATENSIGLGRLSRLVCPGCRAALSLRAFETDAAGDCWEGLLTCGACGRWFPVTAGIPRLLLAPPLRPAFDTFKARWRTLLPELGPASGGEGQAVGAEDQAQVQKAFGHKWTRQPWWGLEGESAHVMEEWLLARYGWGRPEDYRAFIASRATILDAGSGLGREAFRAAAANPTAEIFGLELSDCVDEAAQLARSRGLRNVTFVQADLMAPPFRPGSFDLILSEGVLHHTPDTRRAFESLAPLLAEGGEIAFYVYRKKAPLREFADDHVRRQVQDLTPDEAWSAMEPLTRLGKILSDLKATVEVPEDVGVLGIKAGGYDLQRLVYYTMFKCYWNERLSFDENVHVNFDWYYPRYAWRHTEDEVRAWLRSAGLTLVHEAIEDSGITMRACKHPAAAAGG
jgi:arsenite methyltransferase